MAKFNWLTGLAIAYLICLADAVQFCDKDIYVTDFKVQSSNNASIIVDLDVLAIWSPVRTGWHKIQQLCSSHTGLPYQRNCYRNNQTEAGTWDTQSQEIYLLECRIIPNSCVPQEFQHRYIRKNNILENHINKWPMAKLGEYANPEDPCLLNSGISVTRKCVFNSTTYTAEWMKGDNYTNVKCLKDFKEPIVTLNLTNLYKEMQIKNQTNKIDNLEIAKKLTYLLSKPNTVRTPEDLKISTNILETITATEKNPLLLPKVMETTNLLMQADRKVIETSKSLDTPKNLLKTVENYLDDMTYVIMPKSQCPQSGEGTSMTAQNLTSVFYLNPFCSNISGVAIYRNYSSLIPSIKYDGPTNTYYRYIYLNQSLGEILQEPNLEVAGYIPEDVWEKLQKESPEASNSIRYTLYRNKHMFVDGIENEMVEPASSVLRLSLPGYTDILPGDVPMIFHVDNENVGPPPECGSYNLISWTWINATQYYDQDTALCMTNSLTSFGSLLRLNHHKDFKQNTSVLNIIMSYSIDMTSIIGCVLSLFGLFCIWLTAICCKKWRSVFFNWFLLNICLVLTILIGYLLVVNIPIFRKTFNPSDDQFCFAEGALFHYLTLTLFTWMFIIAIVEYYRFVKVFVSEPGLGELLSCMAIAWLLPLIPTGIVLIFDRNSYLPLSDGGDVISPICYPSGRSFYLALFLPITSALLANMFIFFHIMCSLCRSMKRVQKFGADKDFNLKVRLGVFLFFQLGITWLFGILAHIDDSKILSFLFSLTSSLQGFILFLFCVITDKNARDYWMGFCSGRDYIIVNEMSATQMTNSVSRNRKDDST
ncbi:adhesion G-protein coupled receptor G6-like [Haematobia irritans]|uniref:adhesion G-protein coupled receptor G6-like n=1 Tax=Haematobia irritans TaxID=7368 RepID=UPI003F501D6A